MKEKLFIVIKIVVFIIVCCGLIWGVYSCEIKKDKEKEHEKELKKKQKYDAILEDCYVYRDTCNIYHASTDCYKTRGEGLSYIKKSDITDWNEFISTHYLCTNCINSSVIEAFTHYTTGDTIKTLLDSSYVYNEDGDCIKRIYRQYDKWGNIILDECYEFRDDKWTGIRDICEYNNLGQKILMATYFLSDNQWEGSIMFSQCKMEYDIEGNETTCLIYDWNNGDWRLVKKKEYAYDKFHNKTSEKSYKLSSNSWKLQTHEIYHNYYPNTK